MNKTTSLVMGREATPRKATFVVPLQRTTSSRLSLCRCGQPYESRTILQAMANRLLFVIAGLFLVSVAILTKLAEAISVWLLGKEIDTWSLP